MTEGCDIPERDIPFVKQSKPNSCGAACLTMIYKHYGLPVGEKQVFRDIVGQDARGGQNCRTYLMCQDAINRGFIATAFFANNCRDTIKTCRNNNIELLVMFHQPSHSLYAHFCVVNKVLPGTVLLKDPQSKDKSNKVITFRELADLMLSTGIPGDDICGNNTMIAITKKESLSDIVCANPKCKHFIPVIDEIQDHVNKIICPYCDTVFPL